MPRHSAISLLLFGATVLAVGPVSAQGDGRANQQEVASLLLRAMAYDRALKTRGSGPIRLTVLHGVEEGERAHSLADAFRAAAPRGIADRALEVDVLPFGGLKDLVGRVDRGEIGALFVTEGLEKQLSTILQVSRNRRIPTLTDHPGIVARGVSLGVYLEESQPKLMINLRATRAEGMDLSASVLQLARIVR